jgi:TfoX N-terminal domain.
MAYNEKLALRVKNALVHVTNLKEKKMFGGLAFMVNDKMCITVGKDRIMCRIDPADHNELIKREGTQKVIMKNREYKGYIRINEEVLSDTREFNFWIRKALDYNEKLKEG